jgi:hypothetical protein
MTDTPMFRDDVVDTIPGDIDLPPQMGSFAPPLPPGGYLFRIPANVAQLYELYDETPKDKDGNEIAGGKPIQRIRFKFTREHPLVVVGGPHDGDGLAATISSSPRKRGKKGSDAPSVADLTYLLRESLKDRATVVGTTKQWYAAICAHAGHLVQLKTGLQGNCRQDKARYVDAAAEVLRLQAANLPVPIEVQERAQASGSIEDPQGTTGCGVRYYTKDFKDEKGAVVFEIDCDCGAVLRGFPSIEQFLPPITG